MRLCVSAGGYGPKTIASFLILKSMLSAEESGVDTAQGRVEDILQSSLPNEIEIGSSQGGTEGYRRHLGMLPAARVCRR